MKTYCLIAALFFFASCFRPAKNYDGTAKQFTPVNSDTNCINPWSDACYELSSKNYDSFTLAVKTKLLLVLGPSRFNEEEDKRMRELFKKIFFSIDSGFVRGDIQLDTTNYLTLKDKRHYLDGKFVPAKNAAWGYYLMHDNIFTYQQSPNLEIGYELYTCIKKIISQQGHFRRLRKGDFLPAYDKGGTALFDEVNVYNCLLAATITVSIDDKSGLVKAEREFYTVNITDTAKVITSIDLLTQK